MTQCTSKATPFDLAVQKYLDFPQEMPFEFYLNWHFKNGFVFSTPEFFIMGRALGRKWITDHGITLHQLKKPLADTWYIHFFSGDMNKAWSILPWYLPWIAFERVRSGKRELTILPFEQIKRLTMQTTQEAVL
jgi:hypothetical protein